MYFDKFSIFLLFYVYPKVSNLKILFKEIFKIILKKPEQNYLSYKDLLFKLSLNKDYYQFFYSFVAVFKFKDMMFRKIVGLALLILSFHNLQAQEFKVFGKIFSKEDTQVLPKATIFIQSQNIQVQSNIEGSYEILLPKGTYDIECYVFERKRTQKTIEVQDKDVNVDFYLPLLSESLEQVEVNANQRKSYGMARLRAVDGYGIYEAKKNELIILDDFAANKATNNARQIFAKVPGLNIWESDFAGLQLDIAARGLGPSRTANFNTRQNGYDMSADALGYPESYYTPPMQAVERIEIVRGAASLQYGTQFGGMLNFKLKDAPKDKKFELNSEQTVGSFGLLNTFNSVGGTLGKFSYYGYYQYKEGNGWRPNSGFYSHTAFAKLAYKANEKFDINFEYTFLEYQTQQAGGLTDNDFKKGNLEISNRERNWFQVDWNLFALNLNYKISDKSKINVRNFALLSQRDALGNLSQIDRLDNPNENRTLIRDNFRNFGSELRFLQNYEILGQPSTLLIGGRFYHGLTDRKQGDANSSDQADFYHLNPDNLENFDYDFPSQNYALFAENIFNLSERLSITPGIRFENIRTFSEGTYKQIIRDLAGNIVVENDFEEDKSVVRSFVLLGLGASYYLKNEMNIYANFSQNYRSVTFSDLRLSNPNFLLDSLITDERGFNMDLGFRGTHKHWLNFDVSAFYLRYNDRIGVILPPASTLLFRTNVGDSRHYGIETFVEMDILGLLKGENTKANLIVFSNFSWIDAEYVNSIDNAIQGRKVEYVPETMWRTGLNFSYKKFKATYQFSHLGEQFSDASNSVFNPSAVTGLIPSYHVMDLSLAYEYKFIKFATGINNLTDEKYFTRRAVAYPGPGIIPATARSFYVSLGIGL